MTKSRSRILPAALLASCLAIVPPLAGAAPPDAPAAAARSAPPTAPRPLSRASLQKAVARAERQLQAVSAVLQRLQDAAPGPVGAALRDEYYGSYTAVLRAQGALRADAARFLTGAGAATGEAADATSGATSALALAVEQLRSIRESLVRNEPPASRVETSAAAVRQALQSLRAAAAALAASSAPAPD
jgi:hypothetical protein